MNSLSGVRQFAHIVVATTTKVLSATGLLHRKLSGRVPAPSLLAGVAVLLVGTATTILGPGPQGNVDTTARAVAITGVVVVDREGIVTHLNEAAATIFDVSPEAVLGGQVMEFVDVDINIVDTDTKTDSGTGPDSDTGTDTDSDTADLSAESDAVELERDGRTYEVEASPAFDRTEESLGHIIVFTEVTERRRHERELASQRDELLLVNRLNRVIREVNELLVTEGTRQDILDGTAERLADSELYGAAWAVEAPLLDGETDPCEPMGALDERTAAVGDEEGDDSGSGSVVEGTLDSGREALGIDADDTEGKVDDESLTDDDGSVEGLWTTVPVIHGRTAYGSLVLFSTREDAFGDRELAVLDELARQVGHAVNAVDKELLLVSDTVTELELAATGDDPLAVASRTAGCTLTVDGLVPARGDELFAYCSVEGTSFHEAVAALSRVDGITRLRPIDDATVECRLGDGTLAVPLREVGAQVERIEAEAGVCTVVARVSPDADVRAIVERVRRSVPSTELRAKRRREGGVEGSSAGSVTPELADQLTDRQFEMLEAAYSAGYFEWPRESTAEDVADEMGVSSPTVHNHLRKAENEMLGELLDEAKRPE